MFGLITKLNEHKTVLGGSVEPEIKSFISIDQLHFFACTLPDSLQAS